MAYGAPYYLDTTEISKLTAYYGVYSKVRPFIEASVRALFQEYTPGGALPVSVEGINYDLSAQHGILTPTSVSIEPPSTQPGQTVATTPSPSATPAAQARPRPRVTPVDLFLSLLGMAVLHLVGDLLRWRKGWTRVYRLRLSLTGVACGLVGYLIYALRMLGTGELWRVYGHWGAVLFAVALSLIPLGTALIARGIRATR
jgi:hypothetical protein